ncbi:YcjF family protein [Paracoccus sp. (in: a-proteobacteria)]|uniref:YcjF family protein n=1 Tax=Paracoccus sp. TaxID=267 RepID=UPI0026DFFFAB|nr:TIGR01620 family protein [Paracoccus sp. (in: a-proteobacteria)]MDO5647848.1 TIGR01620 family protein [Paracoccus sp. (in: a-proteobacteria)]
MPNAPRPRGPVIIPIDDRPEPIRDDPPRRGPEPHRPEPNAPRRGPVHADTADIPNPADAAPIDAPDSALPQPRTMQMVTRLVGRRPSRLTRLFLQSGAALFAFLLTVAAWNFVTGLMMACPLLGWVAVVLLALFVLAGLGMALREFLAWRRFARVETVQRQAAAALADDDLGQARRVADDLARLYAGRPELDWHRQRLTDRMDDALDARTLLTLAETEMLAPLDDQARREVEAAARSVAAVTALVPLALADVIAALAANLRMIRRMAEIYGGRAGAVGGWRLARTVITHLVATGAVGAADDLISTVAGGGVLSKVSRRFGEGIVNGALTARVGIAAIEVCRPLPFIAQPRPKVKNLVSRGLAGLFGSDDRAR